MADSQIDTCQPQPLICDSSDTDAKIYYAMALIINIEKGIINNLINWIVNIFLIKFFSDRSGSQEDVTRLVTTFKILNCKLFEKEFHTDLTMDEIQNLVSRFAKDPTIISRILVVMSHGNKYELMDVNGVYYDYNRIILEAFTSINAPHLLNVMKLVMLQACR